MPALANRPVTPSRPINKPKYEPKQTMDSFFSGAGVNEHGFMHPMSFGEAPATGDLSAVLQNINQEGVMSSGKMLDTLALSSGGKQGLINLDRMCSLCASASALTGITTKQNKLREFKKLCRVCGILEGGDLTKRQEKELLESFIAAQSMRQTQIEAAEGSQSPALASKSRRPGLFPSSLPRRNKRPMLVRGKCTASAHLLPGESAVFGMSFDAPEGVNLVFSTLYTSNSQLTVCCDGRRSCNPYYRRQRQMHTWITLERLCPPPNTEKVEFICKNIGDSSAGACYIDNIWADCVYLAAAELKATGPEASFFPRF